MCDSLCVFTDFGFFRNELYSVYIYGLLYQLSADNFFFLVFHVPREKEIVICNFFGKRRMIDRQEIGQITSDQNHVRYGFMNKQNQQLFAVSVNMVDAVAFIQDTLDELEKR